MFQKLVDFMAGALDWLYHLTLQMGIGNYGLAIILFTIIIKVLLYPLSLKQMKSMFMMQQLAPQIKEIQDKYKNKDPQKMQQKIMELYRENNVNPMAGCLPILVQMPILIALYRALLHFNYKNVAHAKFLWIANLSHIGDPYYILPVLAAATTYLQSRLTTNMADQTQRMMLYMMPLFIGWICTTVPAGLGLYWVMFNVLGIGQQYLVNKQTLAMKEAMAKSGGSRKDG
ncbi:MAG: YidC/Oxa1 family membrane protein insertase [Bacillota bacterium]|uniref:YidC/Oxa1 family membrane protein insertase n=1 Tax=Desulfurispora thermophila TaxID=265470 RepID=UPI0003656E16|nr:YidC/Oxa1 family membrane protein insertase [Desulfurispora thermophila]